MEPTDDQLMIDLRGGSRDAFEALFERYKEAVWRFFRRRVREPERADELLQDVFLAVLQNAGRYEPRAAFRAYLFGIAFNVLKAERRRYGQASSDSIPADVAGRDPDLDGTIWVRRALASLDPNDRDIVMLREYEGLSYQEIARLLDVPLNTVRSRLFRARMDLKHALSPESPIELKVGHENR